MIDIIVKYIVQLIMGTLDKLMFLSESNQLKKEIESAKKDADEARKSADSAVGDFKLKLEQYRKSRESDLRRTVDRVQSGSGEAGSSAEAADDSSGEAAKTD